MANYVRGGSASNGSIASAQGQELFEKGDKKAQMQSNSMQSTKLAHRLIYSGCKG